MKTYSEKLKDPRWQRKRLEIMSAADFRCEDCKRSDSTLDIHHCAYIKGKEPWEYDVTLLMCLCSGCHITRQSREDAIKVNLAKRLRVATPAEMDQAAWDVVEVVSKILTSKYAEEFQ